MNQLLPSLRLWQLISPALPVGAYAYSGGLEAAIDSGIVHDSHTAESWIGGLVEQVLGYVDLPVYFRLHTAWQGQNIGAVTSWTQTLQAMRETKELLAEDRQMGSALQRLLIDLQVTNAADCPIPSFATVYALACNRWHIDEHTGATALAWSWVENQVSATVKLVPLGQTDGQRLLAALMPSIERAVTVAQALTDDEIGQSAPSLALLSAQHEQQYSRLFRS